MFLSELMQNCVMLIARIVIASNTDLVMMPWRVREARRMACELLLGEIDEHHPQELPW